MDLGLMVAIQEDVSWDGWLRIVDAAERLGFESVWTSDHLWTVFPAPARKTLAMWPALTAAVLHTTRVRVGQLVSVVTFRHPVELAQNAVALDRLSRGRYILGLGAGWQEREHQAFGFPFPKPGERVDRLGEAVQVIRSLWRGEPVYRAGRFYRLDGAVLRPTPLGPKAIPLLIGGSGERRMLRLVAEYADEWNPGFVELKSYRQNGELLENLCCSIGRDPQEICRTLMVTFPVGRDAGELRAKARRLLEWRRADLDGTDPDVFLAELRQRGWLVGTPETIVEQIRSWATAGIQRIMLHVFDLDDIDGLELLAQCVLPEVTGQDWCRGGVRF